MFLHHDHHHQITKLSHSINAIGPAPHRSGRKREHRSIPASRCKIAVSIFQHRRSDVAEEEEEEEGLQGVFKRLRRNGHQL
jgi:hypothetical protein